MNYCKNCNEDVKNHAEHIQSVSHRFKQFCFICMEMMNKNYFEIECNVCHFKMCTPCLLKHNKDQCPMCRTDYYTDEEIYWRSIYYRLINIHISQRFWDKPLEVYVKEMDKYITLVSLDELYFPVHPKCFNKTEFYTLVHYGDEDTKRMILIECNDILLNKLL